MAAAQARQTQLTKPAGSLGRLVLERLDLAPLLDLELRRGEGMGAARAMHLVEAALCAHREMATFAGAGVAEKTAATEVDGVPEGPR